ncbi:Gfo/Idh/MocA family protein [Paenibacillus cymbidii]|uniref:Gfo/Idh/MocA family protein n=1 Tax=Paenibacillus cymbidii TaxID=1639034 RepID=UPI001081A1E3|nr:hypothetical protein [Paenibacillus cymbidii]
MTVHPIGTPHRVLLLGLEGVRSWHGHPHVSIVGIVDLYRQAEQPFAERIRELLALYPAYASVEEGMIHAAPDVAVVTVPSAAKNTIWAEQAVLEAGVDLAIAKLRLAKEQDLDKLLGLQACSRAVCYVGENYRYDARVRTVKQALLQGMIGRAEFVAYECYRPLTPSAWFDAYRHVTLEDLALHHFSVIHDLVGLELTELVARSEAPSWAQVRTKTMATVLASAKQGYKLRYTAEWGTRGRTTDYIGCLSIEGANGTIRLEGDRVTYYSPGGKGRELPLLAAASWIDRVLEAREGRTAAGPDEIASLTPTLAAFEPVIRTIYAAIAAATRGMGTGMEEMGGETG